MKTLNFRQIRQVCIKSDLISTVMKWYDNKTIAGSNQDREDLLWTILKAIFSYEMPDFDMFVRSMYFSGAGNYSILSHKFKPGNDEPVQHIFTIVSNSEAVYLIRIYCPSYPHISRLAFLKDIRKSIKSIDILNSCAKEDFGINFWET